MRDDLQSLFDDFKKDLEECEAKAKANKRSRPRAMQLSPQVKKSKKLVSYFLRKRDSKDKDSKTDHATSSPDAGDPISDSTTIK